MRARDNAGNDSTDLHRVVRVDSTPPSAWFEPGEVAKPRKLHARVTDALSGVSRATIEYRRHGTDEAWRELSATTHAGGLDRRALSLEAEIPDVQLPEGEYEFRVNAVDAAGNVATSGLDLAGSPVHLRLPLRQTTRLTAGIALPRRCRRTRGHAKRSRSCNLTLAFDRAGARGSRLVDFGKRVALVGQLLDVHANPLNGREARVYRAPRGGGTVLLATTRTDANGFYEMRVPAGPTSKLIARVVGSDSELPATASADVVVRSGLTLGVSDRSIHFGDTLRFRGQLRVIGNANPAGRIVKFQYFNGRGWQFAIGAPKTGLDGRFSVDYRFTKVRKPTTYSFRVAIDTQDGWPFEAGASRPVRVRVTKRLSQNEGASETAG